MIIHKKAYTCIEKINIKETKEMQFIYLVETGWLKKKKPLKRSEN